MDNGLNSYNRFLSGEKDAIDEIIKEYKDGLVYYLFGITRDIQLAEECAVDAFVKLYTDKPRFNGSVRFKTWIYTIGRNRAYDAMRRLSKLKTRDIEEAYCIKDCNDMEKKIDMDEMRASLRRIISRLKSEYSQALCLVFFEDFTNDEAAHIMGKTGKQIRDLLYRAKKVMKKELPEEWKALYL